VDAQDGAPLTDWSDNAVRLHRQAVELLRATSPAPTEDELAELLAGETSPERKLTLFKRLAPFPELLVRYLAFGDSADAAKADIEGAYGEQGPRV
jgi:hypothetical protein